MDYKEKVIALLNDQELSKEQKEKLENIFPELNESKDDRIVRCLLNYFNHVRYNGLDLKGTDIDEVIAWLEKQGKKLDANEVTKPHWISVEDELPPIGGIVLVAIPFGGELSVLPLSIKNESDFECLLGMTHWMPLPQPPKKGGEK